MTEGLDFSPEMQAAGFRNGDILQSLDGKPPESHRLLHSVEHDTARRPRRVLRNGETVEIGISDSPAALNNQQG